MKRQPRLASLIIVAFLCLNVLGQQHDLNALLMESTFKIIGPRKPSPNEKIDRGKLAIAEGTAFIVGRPHQTASGSACCILVTAKHIFKDIDGEIAQITLRVKTANGAIKGVPHILKIRDKGRPLFKEHPSADVAAMYIKLPKQVKLTLIPTEMLGEDKTLEELEIHPGDKFLALGFPLGLAANEADFPSLRSGKMVSSPLTPANTVRTLVFDFPVFLGNSGGPVYFTDTNRRYHGATHLGQTVQFIAGLVSQKTFSPPDKGEPQPELAIVVPAQFIKETIDLLPGSGRKK